MDDCINFNEIIIDGAAITSREEFFESFRSCLGADLLIGSNLDALHDALTSVTVPTDITILSRPALEEILGDYWEAAFSMLMDCLDENCGLSLSFEA
jgi:RNAse (barnase) inhibitor barstar